MEGGLWDRQLLYAKCLRPAPSASLAARRGGRVKPGIWNQGLDVRCYNRSFIFRDGFRMGGEVERMEGNVRIESNLNR